MQSEELLDKEVFASARAQLGANFVRFLCYFREDGVKSVSAIETAMRHGDATAMVLPAHTLKGEAGQFGAEPLAQLAETIEMIARGCIEHRDTPSEALSYVAALRPLFLDTLSLLEREANPLVQRRPGGFGRRGAT